MRDKFLQDVQTNRPQLAVFRSLQAVLPGILIEQDEENLCTIAALHVAQLGVSSGTQRLLGDVEGFGVNEPLEILSSRVSHLSVKRKTQTAKDDGRMGKA
jgi:hypothetical protein